MNATSNQKSILLKLQENLLYAFAVLMLIKASYAIILLIALAVFTVLPNFKTCFRNLIHSPVALFLIAYYAMHAAGMLWSSNMEYGYKDLEMKLSFLLFPILFSAITVSADLRKKVLLAFTVGCIITCAYFLFNSFTAFRGSGNIQDFFYRGLSYYMHPTYLSMYINTALLILLSFLKPSIHRNSRYIIIAACLFLIGILMMLSARMAIVTVIITCSLYIGLMSDDYVLKYRIVYLSVFMSVCAAFFFLSNNYYNRLGQVEKAVVAIESNANPGDTAVYNSATSRPELWREAFTVISSHPFIGAGTGDIKDELFEQYKRQDFKYALGKQLNPHNQFLHTSVGLGLPGLLLLLLCIGSQVYLAWKYKDWLYFCFIIVIAMNGLTESNIEVQSGILLFNFFSMLFYASLRNVKVSEISKK